MDLTAWITYHTQACSSVLDLGTMFGNRLWSLPPRVSRRLGIEIHAPYVHAGLTQFGPLDPRIELRIGDIREYRKIINGERFDCCMLIDVIEHFDPDEARRLLRQVLHDFRLVLVFTPDGFHPQNADHYGMGADHWQTHRSGWTSADLEQFGFTVEVDPHHHGQKGGALFAHRDRGPRGASDMPPEAI